MNHEDESWWHTYTPEPQGHMGDVAIFLFSIFAIAYILAKGL
jgi:hypothetical protein